MDSKFINTPLVEEAKISIAEDNHKLLVQIIKNKLIIIASYQKKLDLIQAEVDDILSLTEEKAAAKYLNSPEGRF